MNLRALGGGELLGNKLVRHVYLDEAGTSHQEPWLVVAGVLIHCDSQYRPIEQYLALLVEKHIPEKHRSGFCFHATDIFWGGSIFRNVSEEKRFAILEDLTDVPSKFNLPVVFGAARKEKLEKPELTQKKLKDLKNQQSQLLHAWAHVICMDKVEGWMAEKANDELVTVIAEDLPVSKKIMKAMHKMIGNPEIMNAVGFSAILKNLPLSHVIGTVHFVDRNDDKLLQLADLCSFFIKGEISGNSEHSTRFFNKIKPQIIFGSADPVKGGKY